jgi:hypothetical protein
VVHQPVDSSESASATTTTTQPTFTCHVALTSVVIRKKKPTEPTTTTSNDAEAEKQQSTDNGGKNDVDDYDEVNCLPKEACLQALADLRHTRWFCTVALNLPSCVECIRLVKDLKSRDPVWSVLTEWTVELLVERALYTAHVPLNPAASIMRVMEVSASSLITQSCRLTPVGLCYRPSDGWYRGQIAKPDVL